MVRIDENLLLSMMQKNARTPVVRLAEELGVTETAVRKKIKKLEEKKILRGYTAKIDPKKLGYEVHAMVGIDTTPEAFMMIKDLVVNMNSVKQAWSSTGDHMLMIECWFETQNTFDTFIKDLEATSGITRTCPAMILNKLK